MRRLIIKLLFCGLCFSQVEENIYSTIRDSVHDFYSDRSTYAISTDGSEIELIMPHSQLSDISLDSSRLLFYNSDTIIFYDFEIIDTLNLVGSLPRFTYDENLIIYCDYPELYKYSLIDDSRTLIGNTYANLYNRSVRYTLSPNKEKLIFLRETSFYDSLDIVVADIQSLELNTITTVHNSIYSTLNIHWAYNDYLYFSLPDHNNTFQLFRINSSSVDEKPTLLTESENNSYLINSNNSASDQILFETINDSINELHLYNLATNQTSFLFEYDPSWYYANFDVGIKYQDWSPDFSEIVIGWGYSFMGMSDGWISIFDIRTGNEIIVAEGYSSGPIFWVDNNTQASTFNSQTSNFYKLYDAYPNPFNPITTLSYDLPKDELVNIKIYDIMGRVINGLVTSKQSSGYKSIQWDATNNQGEPVSAGVYLYKIQAGDFVDTKKMVLLK